MMYMDQYIVMDTIFGDGSARRAMISWASSFPPENACLPVKASS
jgi:hypothetical protein